MHRLVFIVQECYALSILAHVYDADMLHIDCIDNLHIYSQMIAIGKG